MSFMNGRVFQINVKSHTPGERGIPKHAVASARITLKGVEGDFNNYRQEEREGTSAMAVLLIPLETIQALNQEGWPVQLGDLGENFTTQGIPYEAFAVGTRWRIGATVELEISEPCTACGNLSVLSYVGSAKKSSFVKTLTWKEGARDMNRRGWYARVLQAGVVHRLDPITPA